MILRWAIVLTAVAAFIAPAQQTQTPPDADAVLRRVRGRLLADLERLPRYTCVQTITRKYYRPQSESSCAALMTAHEQQKDKLQLRGWDRLRLEVAIADGDNVYSWVAAPRFESGTLEKLAGRGPLGSGDFGPFLDSILSRASVTFKGQESAGNRRLLAYSYDMPATASRYMVRTDAGWVATAYSGVFVIDPDAADIASLTVRTAELPAGNPDCQAISEVEYGRTEIHDRKILIPRETRLIAIARDGSETRNATEYASCREYAAKSRIVLGAAPSTSRAIANTPAAPAPEPLPAGLHFRARIVTLIDSNKAAAGDPLEAVLRSPIRGKNNKELAPAGARLHARLINMEQRSEAQEYFHISIQFESIELKGGMVPLRASPDDSAAINLGMFRMPVAVTSDPSAPDVTKLAFRRQHLHLEKFDWGWTTMAPSSGDAGVNLH